MSATVEAKEFYAIREASRLTRTPAHTLRYWERRLHLLRPTRINGGQRRYSRGDLETILRIKDLLEREQLTLEGAKKALSGRSREGSGDMGAARRALLAQARQELDGILADMEKFPRVL